MWCAGDKIKFTSVLCASKASIRCFGACNAIIYGSLNVMHHFLSCELTQLRYAYFLMQSYECMRPVENNQDVLATNRLIRNDQRFLF